MTPATCSSAPEAKPSKQRLPEIRLIDGVPVPLGSNGVNTAQLLQDSLTKALSEEMPSDDPFAPKMTKAEAITRTLVDDALSRDPDVRKDARKDILDRVLGKPTQRTESLHVDATLPEFLDAINARQQADSPALSGGEIIDVTEPVHETDRAAGKDADPFAG